MKSISELFSLENKVAVVIGGGRGLGLEMSKTFAQAGANVVIASRKLENCQSVADTIAQDYGREALAHKYHAGEWQDAEPLVEATMSRFGKIDILVNNAGMSPLYPSLTDVTEELFDKTINVNLRGPFRLMALVGEAMNKGGGGSIINISSIASLQPGVGELPYAAAKAGINALTLGMAQHLGPKVRVNCILPGPFLTDISKAWDMQAFERRAEQTIPLRRGGEPDEIVGAALYLASSASSYTTGAIIKVDGGSAWAAS